MENAHYFSYFMLILFIVNPAILHFSPNVKEKTLPFEACILSKWCNHTWVEECGSDVDTKLFLDECDRHEFNCDNNKNYTAVDIKQCPQNVTTTTTTSSNSTT